MSRNPFDRRSPVFEALLRRARARIRRSATDALHRHWDGVAVSASIHEGSARSLGFAEFGPGSLICFPWAALYNEHAVRIGSGTVIGPNVSLSAGMVPGQPLLHPAIVVIGDRCVIGRGSSIVGHLSIELGDDVFTGPNVYITDQNHGLDDLSAPIGRQPPAPERPVHIGSGVWLGTGAIVLPGVTIGAGAAIGAGSVVTTDVPADHVAAGVPARVLRRRGPADPAAPGAATGGGRGGGQAGGGQRSNGRTSSA